MARVDKLGRWWRHLLFGKVERDIYCLLTAWELTNFSQEYPEIELSFYKDDCSA